MRQKVRSRQYVVTTHAEEEMAADGYTTLDLESAILTGAILEAQRDKETAERKYRVQGVTSANRPIEVVAKLGPTGKLVFITVYQPE
jgi:hypothetical protein